MTTTTRDNIIIVELFLLIIIGVANLALNDAFLHPTGATNKTHSNINNSTNTSTNASIVWCSAEAAKTHNLTQNAIDCGNVISNMKTIQSEPGMTWQP